MICDCSQATSLPTIGAVTCPSSFGQIQKIVFQRLNYVASGSTTPTDNKIAATSIGALETWTALKAAVDGTKISVTPFVEAPTQDGGDAITYGGGNDTRGGVEKIIGRNPTTLTVALNEFPQSVVKEIKKLQCEGNLGVYLFNGDKQVEAVKKAGTGSTFDFYPIPVVNVFVGDKIHGGFSNPDSNVLKFSFLPNYSDDLDVASVAFDLSSL